MERELSHSELLTNVDPDDVAAVASIARARGFAKGQSVFEQLDLASGFYLVLTGQVKVYLTSPEGREHVLRVVRRGQTFGEAAALRGGVYPASAQALVPTRLAYIPGPEFHTLLNARPKLAAGIIATLSELLHLMAAALEGMALKEASARLAGYLLHEAAAGEPAVLELDVTKGTLAAHLGTTPETLSRSLTRMREAGLIAVDARRVTILDRAGLERAAAGEEP